jgi:hypothetical protein
MQNGFSEAPLWRTRSTDPFRENPDHFAKRLGYGEFTLEEWPEEQRGCVHIPPHTHVSLKPNALRHNQTVYWHLGTDQEERDRKLQHAKWNLLRTVACYELGLNTETSL